MAECNEINNNSTTIRKESYVSVSTVSSVSSLNSDLTGGNVAKFERKASLQEIIAAGEDKKLQVEYQRTSRSMSDGEAVKQNHDDPDFQVFPSLPNSVLEKLGLSGDGPRERLSEEESEQKFTSLALAFAIDAGTIKDRCERQRRYRDQTEMNLSIEIDKLKEKLVLMQPLCTDIEKAELLSTILTQIDIVMNATSLVSISAERYGSVQHEDRLTESVSLMVNHVQLLKQQRDSARRQLQRVLQNSPETPATSPTNNQSKTLLAQNRRIITKRRASIATFSHPIIENNKITTDIKKFTKRTTDLSLRATSAAGNTRPSRLELVGDLDKIKEGFVEHIIADEPVDDVDSDGESILDNTLHSSQEDLLPNVNLSKLSIREMLKFEITHLGANILILYQKWSCNGTIHEICCFCALLCFSMSLLTMLNILVEYEYSKQGWRSSYLFWLWTTDR